MFERFAETTRAAVTSAAEQARELRSPTLDVEHLLLGVAINADDRLREVLTERGITAEGIRKALYRSSTGNPLGEEDAAALRSIGIDLDAVRESLAAGFGANALDRAPAQESDAWWGRVSARLNLGTKVARDAKKALELSIRETLLRHSNRIEAGHLLLGVLRAANPATTELLGGTTESRQLRQAVEDLLDRTV
ncbi:Clp protease N-terminal domain-containing protein [Nocardia sp. alder85J]|uniref:Clp protease N-terminal domain-containing protein n=1 Tax=Nocardia sp. alder85J TaxID=2862949 RepID=UPI001CD34109|nr:Clp protease N-terminal domain-containing protein [Nocardia sp. alder85J]MCX4099289.1 Clp protease [Nocardia sp. alder85J]